MGQKNLSRGSVKPDDLEFDKQAKKKKENSINIMRKSFWNKALSFHVIFFTHVHLHGFRGKSDSELKCCLSNYGSRDLSHILGQKQRLSHKPARTVWIMKRCSCEGAEMQ